MCNESVQESSFNISVLKSGIYTAETPLKGLVNIQDKN
jgi:hypothetical protein